MKLNHYDEVMKFVSDRTVTTRVVNGVYDETDIDRSRRRLKALREASYLREVNYFREDRNQLREIGMSFGILLALVLFVIGSFIFIAS